MKQFKIDNFDSNTSEETVYYFEPINHVNHCFLSDTDIILVASPVSTEDKNSHSAPLTSETNSEFIDTVSNVQTSGNSEKFDAS